jgi:hypothetical protein
MSISAASTGSTRSADIVLKNLEFGEDKTYPKGEFRRYLGIPMSVPSRTTIIPPASSTYDMARQTGD